MSTVKLTQVVEVDAARLDALTPEAFRLVLEARGWVRRALVDGEVFEDGARALLGSTVAHNRCAVLARLAEHHSGSTYDAFADVERVQALLEAVEAAERREWDECTCSSVAEFEDEPMASIWYYGLVYVNGIEMRLWHDPCPMGEPVTDDVAGATREARRQLPRLVRIICGLETAS